MSFMAGSAFGRGFQCEAKVPIDDAATITSVATPRITNGVALAFGATTTGGGRDRGHWDAGAGAAGASSRMSTSLQYSQRASVAPAANSTGAPQLSQRG